MSTRSVGLVESPQKTGGGTSFLCANLPTEPEASVSVLRRYCYLRQVSPLAWKLVNGIHEYEPSSMVGVVESPWEREEGECFAPLAVNVTAVNLEAYYNKAINYTLMVTFISFLQVLLLIRQMEYSNTQSVGYSLRLNISKFKTGLD
jgi:hypothetical protein